MLVTGSLKQQNYQLFKRKSLFQRFHSKHRLKHQFFPGEKFHRHSRRSSLLNNFYRTYQALHRTVLFLVNVFVFFDQLVRKVSQLIEQICQIIRVVHGWICLIHSVISALHLITSRIMLFSSAAHRIFHLLSILLEPFSNRTIEKFGRAFSHFLFDFYSSNGACYSLKARTHHIVKRVRARWRKSPTFLNEDSDEIFYDALDYEYQ